MDWAGVDYDWEGSIDYSQNFLNPPGTNLLNFQDQFVVEGGAGGRKFSAPGDSGSIIVDYYSLQPAGPLFAGDGIRTYCNRFGNVMTALNIGYGYSDRFYISSWA